MSNGIVAVNEKPVAASALLADFLVAVIDGKVQRVTIETLSDIFTEAQLESIRAAATQLTKDITAEANSAADRAESVAERMKNLIDSIPVDVKYDPVTYLLTLINDSGIQVGDGSTIRSGISDIQMAVEEQDNGTKALVMYDADGEEVSRVTLPAGGGGPGGGSASFTLTLRNTMDSRTFSTVEGQPVNLQFEYSSVDSDGYDDGPGVGTVIVGGVKVATVNVPQGANSIDVAGYLVPGANSVKIKVENSDGTSRSLTYTVTVISLKVTTTIDPFTINTGDAIFYYTPIGIGTKTMHFLMDGEELATAEVTSTGRGQSYTIPTQTHGGHIFECYAEMTTSGVTVRSNTLRLGMIWAITDNMTPVVLSTFEQETAKQGEILAIPYMAYDPATEQAVVTLSVIGEDGITLSSKVLTVDRTPQVWSVQDYPIGAVTFRIAIGAVGTEKVVEVEESGVVIEPITDSLVLEFNPVGRSNQEDNPAAWSDGNVSASFNGVGFSGADGWLTDNDGTSLLRLLPGGNMTIPFKLFATDCRDAGTTIEVEMSTHNVRDYDSVVLSCLSGGRGFKIASQFAELRSEQSQISMQFKEDDKVRISFVVEPRNLHRLIYVYVDGVMCGAIQYPTDDNFAQSPATGITIGAGSSGIDLYRIRLYTKGLSRHEILDNYIADRPTLSERIDAHERNDILNMSDDIAISKLPPTLPYMVISCEQLPQYKGDKKNCEITYVNPSDTAKSFTASGVQIDVQGTSSSGYKKKNWKLKLNNGLTYSADGTESDTYKLRDDSIPAKAFCMKADVASSEGANNVELVRLYNDACPYKTPPQQADSRVRVGIDGLPCIIFWQRPSTGAVRFWGKYNFNDEKSSNQVYGLTDGCESWETLNNTSNRVIYKSANFSGKDWQNDFEARYPDGNTDCSRLAAMCAWVVSTDRDAVSSDAEKAARLKKFRDEFEDHFVLEPMLFYYLFTEAFLMVDSRAKNFFPTTFDGVHWLPLPYDLDTAAGINNEGQLVFDYDLEDTDRVDGANVFNGQTSTLWCNIRDAFPDELREMYNELRSGTVFNYAEIVRRYAEHQVVWPEAVWNEDAWEKYLEPLENDNDSSYLTMLQGSKASQREWWMYNGFRYRDSKYRCGDASDQFITLRCYAVGDITVTPYSHIWPRIKYGSYTVTERGKRNTPATLHCPLDEMNDTEVYIYSADRLVDIGDLSPVMVGYANFSMASKLQKLKLGDGSDTYENGSLTELYVGNNELLHELDIQNCPNLTMPVDLSGCIAIETIKAKGSGITAATLPIGGKVKSLELPATVTNLTIREQAQLTSFSMEGYESIATLRIENTPNIPWEELINGADSLNRVRIIGAEWTATDAESLEATYDKLITCTGMDAAGGNTEKAVITGKVILNEEIDAELLANFADNFPDLMIVANGMASCTVRFRDWDGTILHTEVVPYGTDVADPVEAGTIDAPAREGSGRVVYTYNGWDKPLTNITRNTVVTAVYVEESAWIVTFVNWDDSVLCTASCKNGGSVQDPIEAGTITTPGRPGDATYVYTFLGWDKSLFNVTADRTVKARYSTSASVAVNFVDWDGAALYTAYCVAGGSVPDPILAGFISKPVRAFEADDVAQTETSYTYKGWDTSLSGITESKTITATYTTAQKKYYFATFKNWDASVLHTEKIYSGGKVTDPIVSEAIETPSRTPEETYGYIFKGWDKSLSTNVTANLTYTAQYKTDQQFTVTFKDWDGSILHTALVYDEDDAENPITAGYIPTPVRVADAQYTYTFSGWSGSFTSVKSNRTITAQYSTVTRTYTVQFYSGATLLQTVSNVAYGSTAEYTGEPPVYTGENADEYFFSGWTPSNSNIKGDTACYATFAHLVGFNDGYSVMWNYANPSTKLTRLGLATGFANPEPATSLTAQGSSPFDSIMPWAGMKKYNVIDGAISYSEDDAGFSLTDYDTVVYIPEFYFKSKKDADGQIWAWSISPTAKEGFTKHPGSGRYIGRYHTSGSADGVFSKPGSVPLVNTSRPNFRTYSHNKGAKWWMLDIATWSALQMLFLVEFADWDSQAKLGRGYGSSSQNLGTTDAAVYHTYNGGNTTNQYRWVEQPFGRCYDWVDGFMASSRRCYLGTDNATFADSTSSLAAANVTLPSSGTIKGFGYSEEFPWAFLPDSTSGAGSVADYVSSDGGTDALYVGGNYGSYDNYGFWCFNAYYSATSTNSYLGSRLLYIP